MLCGTGSFRIGGKEADVVSAEIIPVAAMAVSVVAFARGLWQSVWGLLAKRAAHKVLADRIGSDEALQQMVQIVGKDQLTASEVEKLSKTLGEYLKNTDLTKGELRRVAEGLNQSNKVGERRYIEDLMKAP
jgi:hypothetical protein